MLDAKPSVGPVRRIWMDLADSQCCECAARIARELVFAGMPLIRLQVSEAETDVGTSIARETYISPGITVADFKASALLLVHDRGITEPIFFRLDIESASRDSSGSIKPTLWQTPETLLELLRPYLESKDQRSSDSEYYFLVQCLGNIFMKVDGDTAVLTVSIESCGES